MAEYSTITLRVLHSDLDVVMEHLSTLTQIALDEVDIDLLNYDGPPYLVEIVIYDTKKGYISRLSLKTKGIPHVCLTEEYDGVYQEDFSFYSSEGQQEVFCFSSDTDYVPLNRLEDLSNTEKLEVIAQAVKDATRPSWLDQKEYGKRYLIMQAITN